MFRVPNISIPSLVIRGQWMKLSIIGYTACVLYYNFLGTASPAFTNFYYTFEKGFVFITLCFDYNKDVLTDYFFRTYAKGITGGTWLFFVMASFNDKFWVYHQTILINTIILSTFGALLALWLMVRRKLK